MEVNGYYLGMSLLNNSLKADCDGLVKQGNFNDESDLDVILIFDQELNYPKQLELAGIIGQIEYENNVFIDHHPMTMEALEKNPIFYEEVVGKGIHYEAA